MELVNFGCGLSVSEEWKNFDASPALRLQRLPILGALARGFVTPEFPVEAIYGNVIGGLPLREASVDCVYCSHVLEHLALSGLREALTEIVRILKPGGIFRGVLPDLRQEVTSYMSDSEPDACSQFMERTSLGIHVRPTGLSGLMRTLLGNSNHLWMWDYKGLEAELNNAGFVQIRRANYGDSNCPKFGSVEDKARWDGCLGFECEKR